MIKKSEAIQKYPEPSRFVEVKPVDRGGDPVEKPDGALKEKRLPPAYLLGKAAGYLVTFLAGFFKAGEYLNPRNSGSGKEKRNRRMQRKPKGLSKRRGWHG